MLYIKVSVLIRYYFINLHSIEDNELGSSEEEDSLELNLKLILQMDEFKKLYEEQKAEEIDEVLTRK